MEVPTQEEILEEIKPLTIELQDIFEESVAKADDFMRREQFLTGDGYGRSAMTRMYAREAIMQHGFDLMKVPNMGIEVRYNEMYSIKVLRSTHKGDVPAPHSISRAAWYESAAQPTLFPIEEYTEPFQNVQRLRLRGTDLEGAIARAFIIQSDGLIHLVIDWEEDQSKGDVKMAVSLPEGAWAEGEEPRVFWRSKLERDEFGKSKFVQTDEDVNFFEDDEGDEGMDVTAV